ncbi:MAG TPA: hypothetical protein VHD84_01110 [Candidatus Saccharimonadales bacterium]|nr:hypothetical protein [Candidatus Saccharimonadales bacterium]
MTATNHAITGALIALAVKKPELALPLALVSHFALDLIPHYNPPGSTNDKFISYSTSWSKKMKDPGFRIIFPIDMILFVGILIAMPLITPSSVSPFTVLISALLGASPDFFGGIKFLLDKVFHIGTHGKDKDPFTRFHVRIQWMERPWGIYVELVWLALAVFVISRLI